jgi:hypothetical protein
MESILSLLQQSQTAERELYSTLRADKGTLTAEEREAIVADINKESDKRRQYYETLESNSKLRAEYKSGVLDASARQVSTLKLLEDQLDAAKGVLNSMMHQKHNKMKMIEINTYFGKQYQGYAGVAIVLCVVLLLQAVPFAVEKYLGAPEVADWLSTILWWTGGLYLLYRVIDVLMRRSDNYDEYVWWMAPTTSAEMETANASSGQIIDVSGIDIPELCLGSYCCGPGTSWSDASGCVIDETE